jgi:hypothetical protein
MSVIFRWSTEQSQLVCIGLPKRAQENIQRGMHNDLHLTALQHPLASLLPLLKEFAVLYDQSVWRIRDALRIIELVRLRTCRLKTG